MDSEEEREREKVSQILEGENKKKEEDTKKKKKRRVSKLMEEDVEELSLVPKLF